MEYNNNSRLPANYQAQQRCIDDYFVGQKRERNGGDPYPSSRPYHQEQHYQQQEHRGFREEEGYQQVSNTIAPGRNVDPSFEQGPDRSNDFCFKCKQKGHWASHCPNSPQPRTGVRGETRKIECQLCGGHGHWGSMCGTKMRGNHEAIREKCCSLWEAIVSNKSLSASERHDMIMSAGALLAQQGHFAVHVSRQRADPEQIGACPFKRYMDKKNEERDKRLFADMPAEEQ